MTKFHRFKLFILGGLKITASKANLIDEVITRACHFSFFNSVVQFTFFSRAQKVLRWVEEFFCEQFGKLVYDCLFRSTKVFKVEPRLGKKEPSNIGKGHLDSKDFNQV